MGILKSAEEIKVMREGGSILGEILEELSREARAGVTTEELDGSARGKIIRAGANPAFLGYFPSGAKKPYPFTLCASINEGVVHGLPSSRPLRDGDLLKLDLGLIYDRLYVDAACTVPIGNVSPEAKRLVAVTREALFAGIEKARPGNTLGDIGATIERVVTRAGFSVAELLTGHGVGYDLHEDPPVYNRGRPHEGDVLEEGMTLALEPMVAAGGSRVRQLRDDSFVTADGSLAAHFEHSIAVTARGPVILTARA